MRIINDPALKQALIDGQPYDVTITVTPVGGSAVTIDMDHLAENGISINPSSVSGNRLELGTVIASAATFTFYNHDGSLDGINFKGAEIHVEGTVVGTGTPPPQVGTAIVGTAVLGGSVSGTFDIGYFIADTVKEQNKRITVSCFDRMMLFDVGAHMAYIGFPLSLYDLVDRICYLCGVTLATPAGTMPNYDLYVMNEPEGTATYRQLIGWAAALMGRCAMINNEGELELKWYEAADWNADTDRRFEGGESAKASITTTGVRLVSNGVAAYTAGADGYTIDVADNGLVTKDNICLDTGMGYYPVTVDTLMDNIWSDIGSITYYPVRTDIIHNVVADVFDVIDFTELDGTVKSVAVTDVIYNLSARTAIQSKGQSEEEASYAQQNPFTPSQAAAVADAGRLKIGRIESGDGNIYFDLDSGSIVTNTTVSRVTGGTKEAQSEYNTDLSFKDGQMVMTLKKDGSTIGTINIGIDGLNIKMDDTQEYSFPKPSWWDSDSPIVVGMRAAYWVANRVAAGLIDSENILNNSINITDKDTSQTLKQANLAAKALCVGEYDLNNGVGERVRHLKDGISVEQLVYHEGDSEYTVAKKSEYKADKAAVDGTIAAATGIRVGSADYNDPAAKAVATEEYADQAPQKFMSGTLLTSGDDLDLLDNGIWLCKSTALASTVTHLPPTDASPVGAFTVIQYGSDDDNDLYGVQIFTTNPDYFLSEIFIRHRDENGDWQSWQKITGEIKPTSWAQVQEIVRAGMAPQVFAIGDQLTCQKNGVTLVWDVIGIDHETPTNANYTHSLTLQMHSIYKNLQFDAREAFYYCSSGLAAGTYYFHVAERTDYSGDVNKNFQFTLPSSVPAGAQLYFNAPYATTFNGSTISVFSDGSSTTALMTVTLSEGASGTSLGTINNAINGDLNSSYRAILGNNNYFESNIRQFLNSYAAANAYWTPQNNWDRPPAWKTTEPGFAYDLDSDFLAVVGNVYKKTAKNTVCDGGSYITTAELFFLISMEEVYGGKENNIDEGGAYEYYSQNSSLPSPGIGADSGRVKYLNGTAGNWNTRTPVATATATARYVHTTGVIYGSGVSNSYGICPACAIW